MTNVRNFLEGKFNSSHDASERIAQYVRSGMLYYGEIPFLYRTFDPTNVRSVKEKSGYKVVSGINLLPSQRPQAHPPQQTRHGLFQQQAILDTLLVYYAKGVKQYLPTVSSPGTNPVGALALICTAVRILKPHFHLPNSDPTSPQQVERALLMFSTGHFILDKRAFSEKFWGQRTAVYVKLAKALSTSQWNTIFAGLEYSKGVEEKLKQCSRPVEHWTDDPEQYFIMESDPVDGE